MDPLAVCGDENSVLALLRRVCVSRAGEKGRMQVRTEVQVVVRLRQVDGYGLLGEGFVGGDAEMERWCRRNDNGGMHVERQRLNEGIGDICMDCVSWLCSGIVNVAVTYFDQVV